MRADGKGMVYGVPFFIKEEGKAFMINNCQSLKLTSADTAFTGIEIDPTTLGQYTGLTDKNGKEIYEGDIIIHEDYTRGCFFNTAQPTRKTVIKINNLFDGIKLRGLGFPPYSEETIGKFEVIGNIHTNPEMI